MPTNDELDQVFELLDMDIHEVSIVDNTANDTEWLAIKSLRVDDFGDFAVDDHKPTRKTQAAPKPSLILDPLEKQSILRVVQEAKAAVDRLVEFVSAAGEQANVQAPDAIASAAKMIGRHLLSIAASSPELEELAAIGKALSVAPQQDGSSEATTLAKSALTKAVAEIEKRDQSLADQRKYIAKLENKVQPPAAKHPERAKKASSQPQDESTFPYMFQGGNPVGAGGKHVRR